VQQGVEGDGQREGLVGWEEPFHWATVLGGGACGELESPDSRWRCGKKLLEEGAREGKFMVDDMMMVLRDEKSGINRPGGDFPTAGSQVSTLGSDLARPAHWLTASPAPSRWEFQISDEIPVGKIENSEKG